jgi:hypothetical protein
MGSRDGSVAARVAILAKHTHAHRMSIKRRYSSAVSTDVPFHPDEAAGQPVNQCVWQQAQFTAKVTVATNEC